MESGIDQKALRAEGSRSGGKTIGSESERNGKDTDASRGLADSDWHSKGCSSSVLLGAGEDGELGHGLQKLLSRSNINRFPSATLVKELEQQKHSGWKNCPNLQQYSSHNSAIHHRSISPWEYRIDYDENRYPPKLAFAHCLCDGCIDAETGEETLSFNSVLLEQTMLVLQRQTCPAHPGQYSFNLKYIKVPIGCTCVLPKKS